MNKSERKINKWKVFIALEMYLRLIILWEEWMDKLFFDKQNFKN